MLRRLLKEPLVHFLTLALVIFAVYGLMNRSEAEKPDRIEGAGQVEPSDPAARVRMRNQLGSASPDSITGDGAETIRRPAVNAL